MKKIVRVAGLILRFTAISLRPDTNHAISRDRHRKLCPAAGFIRGATEGGEAAGGLLKSRDGAGFAVLGPALYSQRFPDGRCPRPAVPHPCDALGLVQTAAYLTQ